MKCMSFDAAVWRFQIQINGIHIQALQSFVNGVLD